MTEDARLGLVVTHRRYVPYSHAHYGGNLVDGAYVLGLFGDVATEVCIRTDGDEGLFASYADVQFRAPVQAGDVVEVVRDGDPGGDAQPRPGAGGAGGRAGQIGSRCLRRRGPRAASRGRHRARHGGRAIARIHHPNHAHSPNGDIGLACRSQHAGSLEKPR